MFTAGSAVLPGLTIVAVGCSFAEIRGGLLVSHGRGVLHQPGRLFWRCREAVAIFSI